MVETNDIEWNGAPHCQRDRQTKGLSFWKCSDPKKSGGITIFDNKLNHGGLCELYEGINFHGTEQNQQRHGPTLSKPEVSSAHPTYVTTKVTSFSGHHHQHIHNMYIYIYIYVYVKILYSYLSIFICVYIYIDVKNIIYIYISYIYVYIYRQARPQSWNYIQWGGGAGWDVNVHVKLISCRSS